MSRYSYLLTTLGNRALYRVQYIHKGSVTAHCSPDPPNMALSKAFSTKTLPHGILSTSTTTL